MGRGDPQDYPCRSSPHCHIRFFSRIANTAMRVQFALCAQTASIDRSSNRLSIFNVIDHFPASVLPITIPALTFVAVIDSDKEESPNVKGVLEISANQVQVGRVELPITFVNGGRLARVVVNFQGVPIREAGPVTFRLTIPEGETAETTFHVVNLAHNEAIQVARPSATQS
jgi:hypothetical protein